MALDSKQKRGSAIGISLPFRQWLTEPDGSLDSGDRVSLLKLCAATPPGAAVTLTTRHRYTVPARVRTYVVIE